MRKNQRIFYRLTKYNLGSVSCLRDNIAVVSKIGEWTYPKVKGSKLFIFDSLESVKKFPCVWNKCFKCRVKNPKEREWMLEYPDGIMVIYYYWRRISSPGVMECYPGTVVCDAFKLIKEVEVC